MVPPEFLRSLRAAFGGCSPHAPEGAVSRPPSGATLPPGAGFSADHSNIYPLLRIYKGAKNGASTK